MQGCVLLLYRTYVANSGYLEGGPSSCTSWFTCWSCGCLKGESERSELYIFTVLFCFQSSLNEQPHRKNVSMLRMYLNLFFFLLVVWLKHPTFFCITNCVENINDVMKIYALSLMKLHRFMITNTYSLLFWRKDL